MSLDLDLVSWALVVALAALGAALAATVISVRAMHVQRRARASARARFAALERDFAALCSSASTSGDRLVSIERRSRDLLARQEQMETSGSMGRHYRHALALLERGASADELVRTCGMARGEAELVAYLHDTRAGH